MSELKLLKSFDDNPSEKVPDTHSNFVDTTTNKFYVVGGDGNSFIVFDLESNAMTYNEGNAEQYDEFRANIQNQFIFTRPACIRSSRLNQIHFVDNLNGHWHFDCKRQQFRKKCDFFEVSYEKLVYVEASSKLMIFGGDESDQIFECEIDDSSQQLEYDWKLNEQLKMPHIVTYGQNYDVLAVNDVIIAVYIFWKV